MSPRKARKKEGGKKLRNIFKRKWIFIYWEISFDLSLLMGNNEPRTKLTSYHRE